MTSLILVLLALYKRWVSPQLLPACRFTPSCSEYAAEAVMRHGALRGSMLAAWRLLRCQPLGGRGLDPVPPVAEALVREDAGCDRVRCGAAGMHAARADWNPRSL